MLSLLVALALLASPQSTDDGTQDEVDLTSRLLVAPGLEVSLWAEAPQFFNPTSLDADERGRIWVAEAVNYRRFNTPADQGLFHEGGDRIVILEDTDRDGRADTSKVFVQDEDLVAPLGIAVIGDRVVVSCSPHLLVYTKDAEDRVTNKEVLLTGFGGFDHDHALHAVELGPDGRWYFNVGNAGPHVVTDKSGWTLRSGSWYTGGSPYNTKNTPGLVSDDGRIWHGGLALSVLPDGRDLRVEGHGFRNAVGTCIDVFGDLWMNDNDDTQSCRTTWLLRGGDSGYDSKDGSRSWQADRRPGQSVSDAHWRQDDPGVIPSGHVYGNGAPTGICSYDFGALGRDYAGGLLLSCEAGQNVVWGYPRRPAGAGFVLEPFVFLGTTGNPDVDYVWHERESDTGKWFRPSDVVVGADGAVYVSDWFDPVVGGHQMDDRRGSGAIYRVGAAGTSPRDPVTGPFSPAVNVRNAAFEEVRAGRFPLLVPSDLGKQEQAAALWLVQDAVKLLDRIDPDARVVGVRRLREEGRLGEYAARLVEDPSPAVRRELALGLRDVEAADRLAPLADLGAQWDGKDPWALEAIGLGAEGVESELFELLRERIGAPTLVWSEAFARFAWRLRPADVVSPLAQRALSDELSPSERRLAIDSLAFLPRREAAEAMRRIALEGPPDLRGYAAFWVAHRATNDWREFAAAEPVRGPSPERERALALRSRLLDEASSPEERGAAAEALAQTAEGGGILLALAREGALDEATRAVASIHVFRNPDLGVRTLASEWFPRETAGGESLPPVETLLDLPGDPSRGRDIFFSKDATCSACHVFRGEGTLLGPDLTDVAGKYDARELLDAILNPSAAIQTGYETWTVERLDGSVVTGFLAGGGETVTLLTTAGELVSIPAGEVHDRFRHTISAMPDNVGLGLDAEELADVLAFLRGGDEEESRALVREPSGLARCDLVDAGGATRFALTVDDDDRAVFVLESSGDASGPSLSLRRRLPFDTKKSRVEPALRAVLKALEDLEGVAAGDARTTYVITSHRDLSRPGECALFAFELEREGWDEEGSEVRGVRRIDLLAPPAGPTLSAFALDRGIVDAEGLVAWHRGQDPNESLANRYAFEIEGLAHANGKLYLGLKWPLQAETGRAWVLVYDLEHGFQDALALDLGGKGISSLDHDPERGELWIVANPPGKPRTGRVEGDTNLMWNASDIWCVSLAKLREPLPEPDRAHGFERGKLEGLARIGAEVWAVYDGGEAHFARWPIP